MKRMWNTIRRSAWCWLAISSLVVSAAQVRGEEWTGQVVRLDPKPGNAHAPVITALAVDPAGRQLALGGDDHLVRIWDLEGSRPVRVLDAHRDWVRTVTYSPNGELLVTSGNDRRVIVWNASTGERLREYSELSHVVTAVVFSHDAALVGVVGFGDMLRIIDGTTGELLREYKCPTDDMRTVSFSHDDALIAGGGRNGVIRLWDTRDGTVLGEYTAHSQRIRNLSFSPDGTLLATCGEDRRIVVSRINGEPVVELPRQGAKVMAVVFCGPDQLAAGGSDNLIHIWDLHTKEQVAELAGHTGTVSVLAYSQDVLVSSGYDTTVRVWKRQTSGITELQGSLDFNGLIPGAR